jgi:hypothetical protein
LSRKLGIPANKIQASLYELESGGAIIRASVFGLSCGHGIGGGSVGGDLASEALPAIADSLACLEHDGGAHHTEGPEQEIE